MARSILVIEADTGFAAQLRTAFEARGAETLVTGEGKEGLQLAETASPDAIVLCVELPRMSGYAVCNKLKKSDGLRQIPLVITSSEATPKTFEQHKKLKTRAEDYVIKPCAPTEVVERVAALVDLGASSPAAAAGGGGDEDLDLLEDAFDALSLDDEPLGRADDASSLDDEPFGGADDALSLDDEPLGGADDITVAPLDDLEEETELEVVDEPLDLPASATGPAPEDDGLDDMFDGLELAPGDDSEGTASAEAALDALGDFADEPPTSPVDEAASEDDDDLLDPMAELGLDLDEEPTRGADRPGDPDLDLPADRDPRPPREDRETSSGRAAGDAAEVRGLTARNAELEAEVGELRARVQDREAAAAPQREVLRLKGELTRRDKEILSLKEALHAREKDGLEFQERENALEMEVARLQDAADEAETRLRELAGKVDAQSHRIGELQGELSGAQAGSGRAAELEEALARAEARVETLEADKAQLTRDRDAYEGRLVEAYRRLKADEALRERTRKALRLALELLDGSPDALLAEDDELSQAAAGLAALGGESS